jgi:hypothetical protein
MAFEVTFFQEEYRERWSLHGSEFQAIDAAYTAAQDYARERESVYGGPCYDAIALAGDREDYGSSVVDADGETVAEFIVSEC